VYEENRSRDFDFYGTTRDGDVSSNSNDENRNSLEYRKLSADLKLIEIEDSPFPTGTFR
jgi:hypothetical protein